MVPQADRLYATYLKRRIEVRGFDLMPNTKKWSAIRATRSKPGVLERVEANRAKRAALLGRDSSRTPDDARNIGRALSMSQSEVSKVERRTDVYVSTLRR
jgi:hypothetical protein